MMCITCSNKNYYCQKEIKKYLFILKIINNQSLYTCLVRDFTIFNKNRTFLNYTRNNGRNELNNPKTGLNWTLEFRQNQRVQFVIQLKNYLKLFRQVFFFFLMKNIFRQVDGGEGRRQGFNYKHLFFLVICNILRWHYMEIKPSKRVN